MSPPMHPAATHHLPPFVTAPGETDALFVFTGIIVLLGAIGIGIFYWKLHALPEQLAHRGEKIQFELVAVLALIALFTHNHAFWIAALLLALIPLPNFLAPLTAIARSLEQIAAAAQPTSRHPAAATRGDRGGARPGRRPTGGTRGGRATGGLSRAGAVPVLAADHPAGLPVSPLRAGQTPRPRH